MPALTPHLSRASLGAIAAAAIAAAPTPAGAQTVFGGGATLPSLTLQQLFAFYTANINPAVTFDYQSVGSGAGLRGWASQDRRRFSPTLPNTDVHFAVSESALTQAQLDVFNNGGQFSSTGPVNLADENNTCVGVPGTGGPDQGENTAGCYTNPRVENGPAIQIPLAGTAVTIVFDPVYKRVNVGGTVQNYGYRNRFPRADGSGGIRLPRAVLCGIFAGQIRQWDDARLTAANDGVPLWPSLADPDGDNPNYNDGRDIVVVHRDDDSGTTSLFTRALRAQCPANAQFGPANLPEGFSPRFPGSPAAAIAAGSLECRGNIPTTAPQSRAEALDAPNYVFNAANDNTEFPAAAIYLRARGSEGVTTCVNTAGTPNPGDVKVGGRIGYVSQDFALPFVSQPPFSNFALQTFDVQNRSGNFIAPDLDGLNAALGVLRAPSATTADDPLAWVASPSGAVTGNRIANPTDPAAYPIAGTTNFLLYTCYGTAAETNALARRTGTLGFLNWFYSTPEAISILGENGFAPLPSAFRTSIQGNFLNGGSGPLRIRTAPSAGTCTTGA